MSYGTTLSLRPAAPFYGVLAQDHAHAAASRDPPGAGRALPVLRRHAGGELRALVAAEAAVGQAQSPRAGRTVVPEALPEDVIVGDARLRLVLEEAALLAVLRLDLEVLPVPRCRRIASLAISTLRAPESGEETRGVLRAKIRAGTPPVSGLFSR